MKLKLTYALAGVLCVIACIALGDAWDNGDDTGAGATPLSISTNWASHGPHTLTNSSDIADWFSFDLEAGKRYRIESSGASDTIANLYVDPLGNTEVDYQDYSVWDAGEGVNFQVLYTPSISGTYYLRVGYDPNVTHAEYDLHYVNEPALDQWDSADDTHTNATLLDMATSVSSNGVHKLGPADDYDWFRFVLLSGVNYTIQSSGGWDTTGYLYKEGDWVTEVSDSGDADDAGFGTNFRFDFTPDQTGLYYLKVQSYDVGYDISYSLMYNAASDPDSDGDGYSDVDEFIAGSNPSNSASYFSITNLSVGNFVLEWPVFSNRVYQVYRTDSLTNAFGTVGNLIYYPQNSYTDSVPGVSRFYKVEVQLQ